MTALEHAYLGSSLVKEIASFGGDVSQMVPAAVAAARSRQAVQSAVDERGQAGHTEPPGTRTEATPIDIIFLIEQLETADLERPPHAADSNVIIDQARALDLLDQLRVAVPEEVRQAKRINEETERIVERAQEEAERILARAQEQAAFLIEERELTRAAEIRSQEIIAEGQREADEIRRGADDYAASVLVKLEGECVKELQSIKRGLALLDERYADDGSNGNGVGHRRARWPSRSRWTCSAITSPPCCARRRAPNGATRSTTCSPMAIADDLTLAEPINGEVRLSRTGRSILARAHLTTAIEGTAAAA